MNLRKNLASPIVGFLLFSVVDIILCLLFFWTAVYALTNHDPNVSFSPKALLVKVSFYVALANNLRVQLKLLNLEKHYERWQKNCP